MATLIRGNAGSCIFLNVESTFLVDAIQSFEVEVSLQLIRIVRQ